MLAVVAVLLGGALGTTLRIGLDTLIPHTDGTFPVSTLIINAVGSLVLGFLVARAWPVAPAWLRHGIGPGLLGGFTTFSAVIVSMVTLAAHGLVVMALVYLALTLVLGFGGAALGLRLGWRPDRVPIIEVDE
jgi:CrcB protein